MDRVALGLVIFLLIGLQGSSAEDGAYAVLLARIERLESQGQEYQELVAHQASQKATIEELQTIVENQNGRIREQELLIKTLLAWKQSVSDEDSQQQGQHPVKTDTSKDEPGTITQIQVEQGEDTVRIRNSRIVLNYEGPVVFHAVLTSGIPQLGDHQIVVFDGVKLNLGGGYHNQTGIFTAPASGIYLFSVSIMSVTKNNDYVHVAILKDGETLGAAYAHGDNLPWDQGSVTVATQLKITDQVWVEHMIGSTQSIHNYSYSSFMGILVVPQ